MIEANSGGDRETGRFPLRNHGWQAKQEPWRLFFCGFARAEHRPQGKGKDFVLADPGEIALEGTLCRPDHAGEPPSQD
jgi:hypothetical protein